MTTAAAAAAAPAFRQEEVDAHFMRQAIAQANLCTPSTSAYSVGALLVQCLPPPPHAVSSPPPSLDAVIASHYAVVATGYSRELGSSTHAEEVCLIKNQQSTQPVTPSSSASSSLPSAFSPLQGDHWLYTSMEPCSRRLSGRTSCCAHLLVSHVKRVVIGALEPDVFVSDCQGRAALEAAGVAVTLMPDMQADCLQPNAHLLQR